MSHARLQRLVVALDAGRPVPADVAKWFLAGARRFERRDSVRTLCECLDLSCDTWRRRDAIRARDEALTSAGRLLGVNCSAWARAGRLQSEIHRFQEKHWPSVGHLEKPDLTELDRRLFDAFSTGVTVPRSQRQLYSIID